MQLCYHSYIEGNGKKKKNFYSLTHSGNLLRQNNFMIVYVWIYEYVSFSQ